MIASFPQERRLNILRPDSDQGLKVICVVSKAVHEWKRWFMCVVFFHLLISHHGGAFPLTVSKIGSNKITVKGKRRSTTFRQITNLVSVNNNFYHLYTSILSKYLKHKSLSLSQADQKMESTFKNKPESTALMGFPTHLSLPTKCQRFVTVLFLRFLSACMFVRNWGQNWLYIDGSLTQYSIDFRYCGLSVLFREEYQS